MARTEQKITAPIPGSATDVVKAIKEVFGLVEDLVDAGAWIVDLYKGSQKKKAARNLETLRFSKGGSKPYLERIIAGTYSSRDLEAIGKMMAESAGEVENSVLRLDEFRPQIRETYGMGAVELLERIIWGPSGKRMIRYALLQLANAEKEKLSQQVIQDRAKYALDNIDRLNKNLRELHDMILGIETST